MTPSRTRGRRRLVAAAVVAAVLAYRKRRLDRADEAFPAARPTG